MFDVVRIGLIFVDEHQRPLAVGTRNGVGGDQRVPAVVFQIAGCRIEFVDSGAVLHPLQIDQPAGVILRGEGFDIQILVGDIVAVGAEAVASRDAAARAESASDSRPLRRP